MIDYIINIIVYDVSLFFYLFLQWVVCYFSVFE